MSESKINNPNSASTIPKVLSSHPHTVLQYCRDHPRFQAFSANPLNKLSAQRQNYDYLTQLFNHSQARFVLFDSRFRPFIINNQTLHWFTFTELVKELQIELALTDFIPYQLINNDENKENNSNTTKIVKSNNQIILLGIGDCIYSNEIYSEKQNQANFQQYTYSKVQIQPQDNDMIYFAVSTSITDQITTNLKNKFVDRSASEFIELRALLQFIPVSIAAILSQSRALLEWHYNAQYCGRCGAYTYTSEGGQRRKCISSVCKQRSLYPRTDSVQISAVSSFDNQKILLGRAKAYPPGIYTCLSGFIEGGESLHEAVLREIYEESGIKVSIDSIQYFSAQPWPFMCGQLMFGCHAKVLGAEHEIIDKLDGELEDCKWFTREEIAKMVETTNTTTQNWINPSKTDPVQLRIPPAFAIAHSLIVHWLHNRVQF